MICHPAREQRNTVSGARSKANVARAHCMVFENEETKPIRGWVASSGRVAGEDAEPYRLATQVADDRGDGGRKFASKALRFGAAEPGNELAGEGSVLLPGGVRRVKGGKTLID